MEPRRPRGETNLVIKQGIRRSIIAHELHPVIFFSYDKISHMDFAVNG
jgi:hypothetical protein